MTRDAHALPGFLVVGAGRSGTTALQYTLMQHPEVFMSPVKETNFFALEGGDRLSPAALGFPLDEDRRWLRRQLDNWEVRSIEEYSSLFRAAERDQVRGEISPLYLYSPRAPQRIHHHVPGAKIIVVLRQPVERAFSAFTQDRRSGYETQSDFAATLELEAASVTAKRGGWRHELRVGMYHEQLSRYFARFPHSHIGVWLYEDLNARPVDVLREIFAFIGVGDGFNPESIVRYNASGAPKSRVLEKVLTGQPRLKSVVKKRLPAGIVEQLATVKNAVGDRNLAKRVLPDEDRRRLTGRFYKDDITRVQELIGVDLTTWLR